MSGGNLISPTSATSTAGIFAALGAAVEAYQHRNWGLLIASLGIILSNLGSMIGKHESKVHAEGLMDAESARNSPP